MGAEGRGRKAGDHVTAIKQIRVGTTCSTVDKQAGEVSGRKTGWSASCNGERVAAGRCRGERAASVVLRLVLHARACVRR